jgi:hypothetical protein
LESFALAIGPFVMNGSHRAVSVVGDQGSAIGVGPRHASQMYARLRRSPSVTCGVGLCRGDLPLRLCSRVCVVLPPRRGDLSLDRRGRGARIGGFRDRPARDEIIRTRRDGFGRGRGPLLIAQCTSRGTNARRH